MDTESDCLKITLRMSRADANVLTNYLWFKKRLIIDEETTLELYWKAKNALTTKTKTDGSKPSTLQTEEIDASVSDDDNDSTSGASTEAIRDTINNTTYTTADVDSLYAPEAIKPFLKKIRRAYPLGSIHKGTFVKNIHTLSMLALNSDYSIHAILPYKIDDTAIYAQLLIPRDKKSSIENMYASRDGVAIKVCGYWSVFVVAIIVDDEP